MDSAIANSLSVLIGSVKSGMVSYLLFILAGIVPFVIAYFGLKLGWNNIMGLAGGHSADLHSPSVPNLIPTYTEADKEAIALFGEDERKRIDQVKASYPALIKKLEAREASWKK
jgi:hypothetical protein